jgi:hypothetical protein
VDIIVGERVVVWVMVQGVGVVVQRIWHRM